MHAQPLPAEEIEFSLTALPPLPVQPSIILAVALMAAASIKISALLPTAPVQRPRSAGAVLRLMGSAAPEPF